MPSTVAHITKDYVNGSPTFLFRMYNQIADIGKKTPVDSWECFHIVVDEDTMNYLIFHKELEEMKDMDKMMEGI